MRWLRTLIAALVLVASAGNAGAHASLVSTSPADRAVLPTPPDQVVLQFDEPVQILAITVVDDSGKALALPGNPAAQSNTIRTQLPPAMRDGTYVLSYRVASADAHPVGGAIAFSIGKATSDAHTASNSTLVPMLDGVRIAVRALRDTTLLIAVGGALFLLLIAPFPGQRSVLACAGTAAAVLSIAGIGLHGTALIGNAGLATLVPWRVTLDSSFGLSAVVAAAAGLTIAVAAQLRRGVLGNALVTIGVLASVVSLPLTGHAHTALPAILARPALAIHVLAAAFWSGSLIALLVLLRSAADNAIAAVLRFSHYALAAVALLIVAGAGFAAMQLSSVSDLWSTRYGNLILAKTLFLAALIALAGYNRLRLTPNFERAEPGSRLALRRSIVIEIALMAVVVAITAALVHTPPRSAQFVKSLTNGNRLATLSVTPGRAGGNTLMVIFRDESGQAFEPAEAMLEIANPNAGVETITRALVRDGPGKYSYEGRELAFAGTWTLGLRARIGDFEQVSWNTTIDIK